MSEKDNVPEGLETPSSCKGVREGEGGGGRGGRVLMIFPRQFVESL